MSSDRLEYRRSLGLPERLSTSNTQAEIACTSCNQKVEASWNYCASCGAYIYLYKESE